MNTPTPVRYDAESLEKLGITPDSCFSVEIQNEDQLTHCWIQDIGQPIQKVADSIMKELLDEVNNLPQTSLQSPTRQYRIQAPNGGETKNGMAVGKGILKDDLELHWANT